MAELELGQSALLRGSDVGVRLGVNEAAMIWVKWGPLACKSTEPRSDTRQATIVRKFVCVHFSSQPPSTHPLGHYARTTVLLLPPPSSVPSHETRMGCLSTAPGVAGRRVASPSASPLVSHSCFTASGALRHRRQRICVRAAATAPTTGAIRVGSRDSKLARMQAEQVRKRVVERCAALWLVLCTP
jgi:hypothetical protein